MKRIILSLLLVLLMASQSLSGSASYSGAGKDTSIRSLVLTNDGTELTTNGTFTGSASGWTLASGWTYSTNAVNKDGAGTGALEQDIGAKADAVYLLTFTISSWTAGTTLTPSIGGVDGTAITGNGTYTQYITSTGMANLKFTPTTDVRCTIDTISAKRVDAIITKNSAGTITGVVRGDTDVTAWTAYTPVVTSESGGWTNYTATGSYKVMDKMLSVFFRIYFNDISAAASALYISLPSGLTMNASVMTGGASWDTDMVGFGLLGDSGTISGVPAIINTRTTTKVLVKYYNAAAGSYLTTITISNTAPWTWTTQDTVDGQFTVPIL